jgi:hypothetical protein
MYDLQEEQRKLSRRHSGVDYGHHESLPMVLLYSILPSLSQSWNPALDIASGQESPIRTAQLLIKTLAIRIKTDLQPEHTYAVRNGFLTGQFYNRKNKV